MIGSAVNQSVFMYLMDEYSYRLKNKKPLHFSISINEIANDRNMIWKTVFSSLQSLQKMKLITINNNICTVDGDRFVSLIKTFNKIAGKERRKQFSKSLETGDYGALVKFGYVLDEFAGKELIALKGGLNDAPLLLNDRTPQLNDRREFYEIIEPSMKNESLMRKSRSCLRKLTDSLSENFNKEEFIECFKDDNLHFLSEEVEWMASSIFDKKGVKGADFGFEVFYLFIEALLLNHRSKFYEIIEGVLLNHRTVNKEINKNKKNELEKSLFAKDDFPDSPSAQMFFLKKEPKTAGGKLSASPPVSSIFFNNFFSPSAHINFKDNFSQDKEKSNLDCSKNFCDNFNKDISLQNDNSQDKEKFNMASGNFYNNPFNSISSQNSNSQDKEEFNMGGGNFSDSFNRDISPANNNSQNKFFDFSDTASENPSNSNSQDKEEFNDLPALREFYKNVNPFKSEQTSSYQNMKKRSLLPFIPVEEIKDIISSLPDCLDRPDKIFINQVWDCLLPCFAYDEEGENGELIEVQQDIEGMHFPASRMFQDILNPAFEATEEMISKGKVNINGIDYPVTATELTPDDVECIIDFKMDIRDGERVYIISKKCFKNIYGELIPAFSRENAREDREKDHKYMQDIILIGGDNDKCQKLTPIETVIYNFLVKYFDINGDGSVEWPKQEFVNRVLLSDFYYSVAKNGVTEQDFLSVLFMNKPESDTGALRLKTRMFSANRIIRWNAIHVHRSIISISDE
jgi:hypothetical protein